MKKTIAVLILVAAAASPALAQEFIQSAVPNQNAGYSAFDSTGYGAYAASTPARTGKVVHHRASAVADPDVNVRLQTQSDIIDR